jgi:hypothetical protein
MLVMFFMHVSVKEIKYYCQLLQESFVKFDHHITLEPEKKNL